jgi:hypothetical protein
MRAITRIFINILAEDKYFTEIFGNKEKVDSDSDFKIMVVPYSYYTDDEPKHKKVKDLEEDEVAGFMLYKEVGDIKEYEAYTFRDHNRADYIFIVYTLLGNKLHILASSNKIEMFLNYGVVIEKTYNNYLDETMVVLDFTDIDLEAVLERI